MVAQQEKISDFNKEMAKYFTDKVSDYPGEDLKGAFEKKEKLSKFRAAVTLDLNEV